MDELTARLQRAATELAERAVAPFPDDIARRGRRRRWRNAAGAVLLAMALAGAVVTVPLPRPWQPAAPTGMPPATPSPSTLAPGHRCPAPATTAQLTANNTAFHSACLAAVAGKPFTLTVDNQDRVPHTLAIFQGSDATGAKVFRGQVFRGPRIVQERVPALTAGDYFFHCDIHPRLMQGQLIVR
jgi:plastocyanin